jgi:hypothetical protein
VVLLQILDDLYVLDKVLYGTADYGQSEYIGAVSLLTYWAARNEESCLGFAVTIRPDWITVMLELRKDFGELPACKIILHASE